MNGSPYSGWQSVIGTGVLCSLLGLIAIIEPEAATGFVVILAGVIILVLAVILLTEGITGSGTLRWIVTGLGTIGILLGFLAILKPAWIITTAGVLLGISLMIFGALIVAVALTVIGEFFIRLLLLVPGIISVLFGIFFFIAPGITLEIFAIVAGLFLVLVGITRIVYGLQIRKAIRETVIDVKIP